MMDWVTIVCALGLTASIVAGLIRMTTGPTILDRILSFDMLTICGVAFMAILSLRWHTTLFLELILIVTLLGFFSTVALVFYLEKSYPPYPPDDEDAHDLEQKGGNDDGRRE